MHTSAFIKAYSWFWSNGQRSWPWACTKDDTNVRNWRAPKSWIVLILILVKSFRSDNSVLILDNAMYLKWANCTYLLAKFPIQRSTEHQYKSQWAYPLDLWTSFWWVWAVRTMPIIWEYGQYVLHLSYDAVIAMVCCGRKGRSEFLHSLCLIDWWSWRLSHKIHVSENRKF